MTELLKYLIVHFAFLYEDFGARFVDSLVNNSNAVLILQVGELRLRFVRDRDQLFLDFQGNSNSPQQPTEWFSYDIIRQFITGEVLDSSVLDEKKALFVKNNYNKIAKAFSKNNYYDTKKILRKYEKARAKRLFG